MGHAEEVRVGDWAKSSSAITRQQFADTVTVGVISAITRSFSDSSIVKNDPDGCGDPTPATARREFNTKGELIGIPSSVQRVRRGRHWQHRGHCDGDSDGRRGASGQQSHPARRRDAAPKLGISGHDAAAEVKEPTDGLIQPACTSAPLQRAVRRSAQACRRTHIIRLDGERVNAIPI